MALEAGPLAVGVDFGRDARFARDRVAGCDTAAGAGDVDANTVREDARVLGGRRFAGGASAARATRRAADAILASPLAGQATHAEGAFAGRTVQHAGAMSVFRRPSVAERVRSQTSFLLVVPSLEHGAAAVVAEAEVPHAGKTFAQICPQSRSIAIVALGRVLGPLGSWYTRLPFTGGFAAYALAIGVTSVVVLTVPGAQELKY